MCNLRRYQEFEKIRVFHDPSKILPQFEAELNEAECYQAIAEYLGNFPSIDKRANRETRRQISAELLYIVCQQKCYKFAKAILNLPLNLLSPLLLSTGYFRYYARKKWINNTCRYDEAGRLDEYLESPKGATLYIHNELLLSPFPTEDFDPITAEMLLNYKAHLNRAISNSSYFDKVLCTEASVENKQEVICYMLNNGADINHRDPDGYTPLFNLIRFIEEMASKASNRLQYIDNYLPIIDLLIAKGARIDVVNKDNNELLDIATKIDSVKLLQHLLAKTENPQEYKRLCKHVIKMAKARNKHEIITAFVKK